MAPSKAMVGTARAAVLCQCGHPRGRHTLRGTGQCVATVLRYGTFIESEGADNAMLCPCDHFQQKEAS